MCLNLTENAKEQVALENIPCYKSLHNRKSTARSFLYINFKINEEVDLIPVESRREGLILEEGYHSRLSISTKQVTHLFVIPKNAKYYNGRENSNDFSEGLDGYVSSTIIYIGRNNMFNRLIGKIFYNIKFESEKNMDRYGKLQRNYR